MITQISNSSWSSPFYEVRGDSNRNIALRFGEAKSKKSACKRRELRGFRLWAIFRVETRSHRKELDQEREKVSEASKRVW